MKRKAILIFLFIVFAVSFLYADTTVYITKTGKKYHLATCSYLRKSKISIPLSDTLARGHAACSRCKPPTRAPAAVPASAPAPSGGPEALALPYTADPSRIQYYTGFSLLYSEEQEQPAWVAYLLTADETRVTTDRTDNFRADPGIPTGSSALSDYRGSGFDRGHLAPAGGIKWSSQAMRESFLMSNMSPQRTGFNRGIWKKLEECCRDQAASDQEVYVVTGPVLTDGPYQEIGPNGADIPKRYFKVILDYRQPGLKRLGLFCRMNQAACKYRFMPCRWTGWRR